MPRQKIFPFLISVLVIFIVVVLVAGLGYTNLSNAEAAAARGEYRLAAEAYIRAAETLFWREDLTEQAGLSYAKAGDYSAAIEQFKQAQNLSEEGWVGYCTAHIQLDDVTSAIKICSQGAETQNSARLYQLLAFIHQNQKDWDAERLALENQTRLDPNDAYAAYRLGLLLTLYSPENALPELTRASTLNPEVDSAVQTLRTALAVSQEQVSPSMQMVVIGQAFGLLQDWELALEAFEQAVQLDETNAEAWAWLGEAKQQTGQSGSAEMEKALSLDRNSVNVRALRGLYWSRQGKYEQMLAEYLLAAGIEPENPRWQASIGEAYTRLDDLVSALTAYQKATELAPTESEYWRLLALFCAENGVQVEGVGVPAAQQALALAPDDPAALDALGYAYLSSGRYASAEEALKRALEISPEYLPAHLHLAMNYLAQGNRAAAFNVLTYVRDAANAGSYAETARQLLEKYFQ